MKDRFSSYWSFLKKWLHGYFYEETQDRPNKQDVVILITSVLYYLLLMVTLGSNVGGFIKFIFGLVAIGVAVFGTVSLCRIFLHLMEK